MDGLLFNIKIQGLTNIVFNIVMTSFSFYFRKSVVVIICPILSLSIQSWYELSSCVNGVDMELI